MEKRLVYDLPMRLFHWTFAILFVLAFLIAKTIDDDSITFAYHMIAGLLLVFATLMRILWGLWGAEYSRFKSFALKPRELFDYLLGILAGSKKKWAGHNPASSWASLIMFVLALSLGITGYLMTTGQKENFEDLHELLANGFLVVVLMHVAGVALHGLRHRDEIFFAMLNGKKRDVPPGEQIADSKRGVAILYIVLLFGFAILLFNSFDQQSKTLQLFGSTLQMGDSEMNFEFETDED